MRKKLRLYLIACVLLLFAIGLGIESLYGRYFGGRDGFQSFTYATEANGLVQSFGQDDYDGKRAKAFADSMTEWAVTNKASIIISDLRNGKAVCDVSGRIQRYLREAGVSEYAAPLDGSAAGVYIANDPSFIGAYVEGGVFMPGFYDLPVLGYYDSSVMPQFLNAKYIYSLSSFKGGNLQIMVYSDSGMDEFRRIACGAKTDQYLVEKNEYGGFWGFVSLLFYDPQITRSGSGLFHIILALTFCFCFNVLLIYREIRQDVSVRHLFGMSFGRFCRVSAAASAGAVVLSSVLFGLSMEIVPMSELTCRDKMFVLGFYTMAIAALTAVINLAGMLAMRRALREKTS